MPHLVLSRIAHIKILSAGEHSFFSYPSHNINGEGAITEVQGLKILGKRVRRLWIFQGVISNFPNIFSYTISLTVGFQNSTTSV